MSPSQKASLSDLGLALPDLLLPNPQIDMERWAVIACDQFTSDMGYWDRVEALVGSSPSTLSLILPEAYLETPRAAAAGKRIAAAMALYPNDDTLVEYPQTGVYLERRMSDGSTRRGIVLALDLEAYDYTAGSQSMVRASEATIESRLPARADVRRKATLETPHVLVLYDDRTGSVADAATPGQARPPLYDTPLMLGGGHATGWPIDVAAAGTLAHALAELPSQQELGFLFATGDGNHSLAAARQVWLEAKAKGAPDDDPRRYALVELVNVHDPGLSFHPIHRVADVTPEKLELALTRAGAVAHEASDGGAHPHATEHELVTVAGNVARRWQVPAGKLPVALADEALAQTGAQGIDYVHEFDEAARAAARMESGVVLVLPEFDRAALLPTVARDGALPRKAFSLGRATDKRYYLECRRLVGGTR